ncbi:CarD-like transcriptional regulator [Dissulfuribacter thermophilus]|uniref:CarD-like transcriptional regulator n=1 Tax=Dissulfuribacter thermophilus TaxID=1156395 RepID=A0A1B9F3R1_9BACT|nr:CarD family transcriptional regulator [Dissulfuribacter thermophilus]OCC14562.1 CarD-like transcriptional regulator [Dissulfuribacter thermophilus]
MFNVGDLAVYPAHGVGVIEAIEQKAIGGNQHTFYVMRILENDMKILVPKGNVNQVGLRGVMTRDQAEEVYSILKDRDVEFTPQAWNRRYREYMEKIKTGSVRDLAVVLRDLYLLQMDKPLSFGEKKMLESAKALLIKEIAIAKGIEESKVQEEIESIFTP